jgi:hypothetical protein
MAAAPGGLEYGTVCPSMLYTRPCHSLANAAGEIRKGVSRCLQADLHGVQAVLPTPSWKPPRVARYMALYVTQCYIRGRATVWLMQQEKSGKGFPGFCKQTYMVYRPFCPRLHGSRPGWPGIWHYMSRHAIYEAVPQSG